MEQVKKKFAAIKLELDEAKEEADNLRQEKKEADERADAVSDSLGFESLHKQRCHYVRLN